jgi:glycosyltransferase involved in cell wall biosynthesis
MDNRIAIILTSIERPQALKKSVESILAVWQENWVLLIGDQNPVDSESFYVIEKFINDNSDKDIRTFQLDYNCGISVARNELIHFAHLIGCEYVILTADSILFNESMKDVEILADYSDCDLIGINLENRIPWEATLNLIPEQSFELDFINPKEKNKVVFVPCDIVRNFWLADIDVLLKVPYDEQLVACEHEDFFWRAKQQGVVVGCTNLCSGTYNKSENTPKYDEIRSTNLRIGMQRLKDKYSLKGWVSYKNLENTKL